MQQFYFSNEVSITNRVFISFYSALEATPTEQAQQQQDNKPKKKRFEVKKWTAVAFWSWDQSNETCAICRNHLMEPCIDCAATGKDTSNCPRAVGMCNHSFHLHCIDTWIKTRNSWPLDSSDWSLKEVIQNGFAGELYKFLVVVHRVI